MADTRTKERFFVCQETPNGKSLWLVMDAGEHYWLTLDDLQNAGFQHPQPVSEAGLQTLANQYGKLLAFNVDDIQGNEQIGPVASKVVIPEIHPASASKTMPSSTVTPKKPRRSKLIIPRDRAVIERPHSTHLQPHNDEPRDLLEHVPTAFLWVLLVTLLLALGVALSWNVQPFIDMTRMMASSVGGGGVESVLSVIPIIGPMLLGIGGGILVVTALVWFAIFQLLELAPMLMTASSKRVLRMINAIAYHAGVQIRPGDNADVVWLKQKYNNRPVASLQFFRTCRIVVLTMEAAICWITHPPTPGTPIDFLFFLVTGQFSKITWGNVFLMLSLLFLIEALVRIALHTWNHIEADRQIAKAEKEAVNA